MSQEMEGDQQPVGMGGQVGPPTPWGSAEASQALLNTQLLPEQDCGHGLSELDQQYQRRPQVMPPRVVFLSNKVPLLLLQGCGRGCKRDNTGAGRGWSLRSIPNQSIPWFSDNQVQDWWWTCTGRNPKRGCAQVPSAGDSQPGHPARADQPSTATTFPCASSGLSSNTHSTGTAPFSQDML